MMDPTTTLTGRCLCCFQNGDPFPFSGDVFETIHACFTVEIPPNCKLAKPHVCGSCSRRLLDAIRFKCLVLDSVTKFELLLDPVDEEDDSIKTETFTASICHKENIKTENESADKIQTKPSNLEIPPGILSTPIPRTFDYSIINNSPITVSTAENPNSDILRSHRTEMSDRNVILAGTDSPPIPRNPLPYLGTISRESPALESHRNRIEAERRNITMPTPKYPIPAYDNNSNNITNINYCNFGIPIENLMRNPYSSPHNVGAPSKQLPIQNEYYNYRLPFNNSVNVNINRQHLNFSILSERQPFYGPPVNVIVARPKETDFSLSSLTLGTDPQKTGLVLGATKSVNVDPMIDHSYAKSAIGDGVRNVLCDISDKYKTESNASKKIHKCKFCPENFKNKYSLNYHCRWTHRRNSSDEPSKII